MKDNSGIKKRVALLFLLTITLFFGFYQIAMGLVTLGIPTPGVPIIIIRMIANLTGLVESIRLTLRKDFKVGVSFLVLNLLLLFIQLGSIFA